MIDLRRAAAALGGEVSGRQVRAPGPGHSRADRSLSVRLDARAPEGFVVTSFAGDDWQTCRDFVRARLGLPEWRPGQNERTSRQREASNTRHTKAAPADAGDNAERLRVALWLWQQRKPIAGTLAERYLREVRGYRGALPATLGFLPARGKHGAAMFGIAEEPEPGQLAIDDSAIRGVHLTRLTPDGRKKIDGNAKIMLGSSTGWPICLAPASDLGGLLVTEGIEDALSGHAVSGLGAWAAGSASRLPTLADAVPDFIECISIAVDPDSAGQKFSNQLARRLVARNIEVRLWE